VLRHSFISYRIAIAKSADQVALEAGHSRQVNARIPDSTGDWRRRLSRMT